MTTTGCRRRTAAALAVALALAAAEARAGGAEPLVLTLEEAVARAVEQGHEVRKAREYAAQVEGRYVQERSAALPQFAIAAGVSRADDESQAGLGPPRSTDSSSLLLAVNQPIFTWGQVPAAIRAADIGRATAADRLATARSEARRDATTAFTDVLLARELESLAVQNLEQKQRHLDEARRRLAAGTVTDYDVLAAEVAVENARPERIRLGNRVQAARERLAYVVGIRESVVDVTGSLDAAAAPVPDAAEALRTAVALRPDLAELRKNHRVAQELVRIAAAGNKPRLDLSADGGYRTVDLDGRSGEGGSWSAGLLLRWPVFDGGRTRGAVARAESDARAVGLEIEKFVDALALETRTAVDAVREAAAIVEALGGTVAQAERLLAMAEQGFTLGVKTRLDVDDAQLNLIEARAGLARGRRDLLVSRAILSWIMGTP